MGECRSVVVAVVGEGQMAEEEAEEGYQHHHHSSGIVDQDLQVLVEGLVEGLVEELQHRNQG